jgi:hypothetical protein
MIACGTVVIDSAQEIARNSRLQQYWQWLSLCVAQYGASQGRLNVYLHRKAVVYTIMVYSSLRTIISDKT